jgi:hypothetical protein
VNRRLAASAALLLTLALPLHADFASIARAIDAKDGVKRVWIPFLGLARTFVRVVEPHGVNDFQLVTFEGSANLDGSEMQRLMREKAGPGFRPLVQVRSKGEWTFIYAKPARNAESVELLVLTIDDDETVLVRVDLDAEVFAREMGDPRHVGEVASR